MGRLRAGGTYKTFPVRHNTAYFTQGQVLTLPIA
jgi:hypothetical protein